MPSFDSPAYVHNTDEQPNSAVSTPPVDIQNALQKASHSFRITFRQECSESAQEQRTALYKSDQQQSPLTK